MEQNNVEEVKTNEMVNTNVDLSEKQDEVIQRTDIRSAYETPTKEIKKDPSKIAAEKEKQVLMRQQDYEKIVQKVRAEEQKNLAEQEKIIEERNKKEKIEKEKEEQRKANEERIE